MQSLREDVERLFSLGADAKHDRSAYSVFQRLRDALTRGEVRAAQKEGDRWITNIWVKEGILLGFRLGELAAMDNPGATAWMFFGDGRGDFKKTELVVGQDWHEARLADLDGDGDLDLLEKPYTWDTPRIDVWLNQGLR